MVSLKSHSGFEIGGAGGGGGGGHKWLNIGGGTQDTFSYY